MLAVATPTALGDAAQVELLRALEELKCVAEAAQARTALALDASVREDEARCGCPTSRQGRGVGAQVALARRESHARGRQHLGLARILASELPHTLAAFRAGRINEWRATLLARETACLSRQHRQQVDTELAGDPDRLEAMGDAELVAAAKRLSYRLDPESAVARRRKAESERRVSLRPAPDVMTQLSALLPMKDGVAVFATLDRAATAAVAAGDGRSRGQIMADTLVARVLGAGCRGVPGDLAGDARRPSSSGPSTDRRAHVSAGTAAGGAAAGWRAEGGPEPSTGDGSGAGGDGPGTRRPGTTRVGADVSVMIHLVVSDAVLLGGAEGAAHVDGYGPVPGDLARQLAGRAGDRDLDGAAWLRRLYVTPATGDLVAADARARRFPAGLARLIRLRDQRCRTPWCDAPIRHLDHVTPVVDGGSTSLANGQGLCETCNYAKQALGWTARPRPGPRHTVRTTTPTGHRYGSTAVAMGDESPGRGELSA